MSDTSLNKIIQYGTDAARIAFTPAPAAGSQVLYLWYTTDTLTLYLWNGSAWISVSAGTASILTASGSVNNAAILAMRTTPVVAVAAPGANRVLIPRYLRCLVDTNAGGYTNIITAGGTNAWFALNIGSSINGHRISILDDSTLNANLVNGAPLAGNMLPGFNPNGFTSIFGIAGKFIVEPETKWFRDYSPVWGIISYGYLRSDVVNQPLQFMMGNDGAAGNLTGGNAANTISWYLEYENISFP